MSSPFLAPTGHHRRTAARQRKRQRTRRLAAAAFALAVLAAAAIVVATALKTSPSRSAAAPTPTTAQQPSAPPALSPLGLPLGAPALHLQLAGGLDPVRAHFPKPPRAGLLFDLDSGRVLWRDHPRQRLPIASLTKMMSALVIVQDPRAAARAPVPITHAALAYVGSGIGLLKRNMHVQLDTLLYGLLLPSANDAAIALAQYVDGTVPRFVQAMNVKAAQLGLGCTRFSSPSGILDQDNYSCAADLAVLAHDDLAEPRIARITGTASAVLPFPIKGGRLYLYNNNPLFRLAYPGLTGLKTGYTTLAGRCLVATARRGHVRLGVVLLGSTDPPSEAITLLNRGFAAEHA